MNIFEMIEEAKKSEYGATWFSDKGPIHISTEGNLIPIKLGDLPTYQPERSKREDKEEYCNFCGSDGISKKCQRTSICTNYP